MNLPSRVKASGAAARAGASHHCVFPGPVSMPVKIAAR
jgi:hypothetical protein